MDGMFNTDVLESYCGILTDWLPDGASIAVAMNDTFIYFISGHANISLQVGSKVPENSIAYRVLTERKKVEAVMETTLFDTPYYAIGYPVEIQVQPVALIIVLPPMYRPQQHVLEMLTGKDEHGDYFPILIQEIHYFESLQKKIWIYRNENQYKTAIPLKELQTRLPSNFVRVHRSYIVNLNYISRISKDFSSNYIIFLKNGVELPVSQSYIHNLKAALSF